MQKISTHITQEILDCQQGLRDRLLRRSQLSCGGSGRELAAEMLLYLDDPASCWSVLAKWLLTHTRAQRVDVGFGLSADYSYSPKYEYVRTGSGMSSVIGMAMNARDSAISIVWSSEHAVSFPDIERDDRLCPDTRLSLLSAGTRSKVAVALRDGRHEVGLLCCDATNEAGAWSDAECWTIDTVAREVVGPVLAGVNNLHFLQSEDLYAEEEILHMEGLALSPAESKVSQLVVSGMSYKEIARVLGRSPSTIDHQLRSIRRKMGVPSNAKLIHVLMSSGRDVKIS